MATNKLWRVIYGFRDSNKKHAWDGQQVAIVLAADSKEDTIRNVLTSNGIGRPGATIDIISVGSAGADSSNVLS